MSLGKLLTTGKSLVGLSNSNSRYQLQKGALPKFESAKNPFAKGSPELPEREPQLPKLTPTEVAAANLKKTQAIVAPAAPAEQPVVAASSQAKPAEPPKVAPPIDGWLKKINPMVWFGNRKPAEPKSAIPRFGKSHTPVQGELSLDNIKVMRNDLSETDVEIVTAKSRPAKMVAAPTQASAAAMAIPDLPPATAVWEYLGERLLGKD
jgi:hypothetical protein